MYNVHRPDTWNVHWPDGNAHELIANVHGLKNGNVHGRDGNVHGLNAYVEGLDGNVETRWLCPWTSWQCLWLEGNVQELDGRFYGLGGNFYRLDGGACRLWTKWQCRLTIDGNVQRQDDSVLDLKRWLRPRRLYQLPPNGSVSPLGIRLEGCPDLYIKISTVQA